MNNDSEMTGYSMPSNPKMCMDEDVEEVTRKIAPAMVMPSLRPMPNMIPTSKGPFRSVISSSGIGSSSSSSSSSSGKQQHQMQQRRNESSPSSSSFSWLVRVVPTLPEFHSLERSATFVPNAEPSEVSSRISDTLRERSIEAHYGKSTAIAKCRTAEGVDFRVRLYRGRGRFDHGIIVEVQRRFGTSLVFYNDTQAILDGAKGMTGTTTTTSTATCTATCTVTTTCAHLPEVSESDEDYEEDQDYNEDYNEININTPVASPINALEMVAKMMQLSGFDSQYLGLQTLSPLVDSRRLSVSTARSVAEDLLKEGSVVGEKVLDYVLETNKKPASNSNTNKTTPSRGVFDDDEDDEDDGDEDESYRVLRNMCLNILANAMKAHRVPDRLQKLLSPILVQNVADAEEHPNTAFLAAKCLEQFLLNEHEHEIANEIANTANAGHNDYDENKAELCTAFRIAYQIGEDRHANLMRQAVKCLVSL